MTAPVITIEPNRLWQNWHVSSGVGGKVARFFTPHNQWADGTPVDPSRRFAPGLAALQSIVRQAESDQKRVRACGSGWSLSSAAFVDDYLINTSRLTVCWRGFATHSFVEPAASGTIDRLVFAQCGTQIKQLNMDLEAAGLALPTSGASNGQTIVGAMSTGTHGSAHDVGAIQDFILALHIVGEGGKPYWVEHPDRPTMARSFTDWLGAELIRDEDLFLSALVGFGSFGIIHAVMFRAEPLYELELFINTYDHDDVWTAACSLDVHGLGLPWGDVLPFHFEVVFNPYLGGAGQRGAFVRAMRKKALVGPPPLPPLTGGQTILSRDLVSIAGLFADGVPAVVPQILQSQLQAAMPVTKNGTIRATPGIQFGDSQPTNGGTSLEIGVPLAQIDEALETIFSVTDAHVFGAPVALRYVKSSDALLAFTCHEPITCTIEIPGVDSATARSAHQVLFQELSSAGLQATYHWGQRGPFTPAALLEGFGQERIDRWRAARQNFLTPAGRRLFSNALLDGCGLST